VQRAQVAVPFLPPRVLPARWCKGAHLPLAMLRAGHAVVYEQAGAEYGALGKDAYSAPSSKQSAYYVCPLFLLTSSFGLHAFLLGWELTGAYGILGKRSAGSGA
jgi:hypothetical protein